MQHSSFALRVQIVQPVVAGYRRPFFEALLAASELSVTVDASPRAPGLPPSVPCFSPRIDTTHRCLDFFGGRLLWQRGLRLHADMRVGDMLVVTGNPRFVSNLPLMLQARRRGVSIAWWGHGWSATSKPQRAALRLWLMRRTADVVVLYTDAEIEALAARGFERHRLFALNNAIDQTPIQAARRQWPAARLEVFRREQHLTARHLLLFCGRLRRRPSTDLDIALRALALLVRQDPSYELAVIGDGPNLSELLALAAKLGIQRQIRWLGAIYDEVVLAPWFLSAACFVYPGSVGLSLMQAFGYGLPVVTHNIRREHNPEIAALEDNVNGLLFPRGDAAVLAERLRTICNDEHLRIRLGANALDTVTTRYTMTNMVARFIAAVTSVSPMRGDITPATRAVLESDAPSTRR
jgi:glycosyltransferase involved in cell wall biosynthesis